MVACAGAVQSADPARGERLFMTAPRAGDLACADCHSDNPVQSNFGGIWAGRNASAVIQRAIQNNAGGMGVFLNLYRSAELADIAAYLGNSPYRLDFAPTTAGATSAVRSIAIASSLKQAIDGLSLLVEGPFVLVGSSCATRVPAFDECRVDLAFRPQAEGESSGALVLNHAGTPTPVRLPLAGSAPRIPRAVATLGPARVVFGSAVVGTASGTLRHATLANHSANVLTIGAITASPDDFVIAGGSCVTGHALRSGERCLIALRFAPRSGGQRSGMLTVAHDGVGGSSTLALEGAAAAGVDEQLLAEAPAVDFGAVLPGQRSAERSIVWTQAGSSPLGSVAASTSDARFEVVHHSCSGPVAPLQRCETKLVFAPTRAVATSGELRLGTLRVPLAGRGQAAGSLAAEPRSLAFDEAAGAAQMRTLRAVNDGRATVVLGAPALSGPEAGDFAIADASPAATACRGGLRLEPSEACQLALRFAPAAAGSRTARLQLPHDGAGRLLTIDLNGAASATARSRLGVEANAVDLGALRPGESRTQILRLENTGRVPLRWATLAIAGEAAAEFSIGISADACSPIREVPAGASCRLTLNFSSTSTGLRSATLVLWPADQAEALLVSLEARVAAAAGSWNGRRTAAAEPALQAEPAVLTFEALVGQAGAPAQTLRLANQGQHALTVTALASSSPAFVVEAGDCLDVPRALLPGDACTLQLRWSGAAISEGQLRIDATGTAGTVSVTVPLAVSEDPAQRSNVGGSAGGGFAGASQPWWLLALALAWLAHRQRRR